MLIAQVGQILQLSWKTPKKKKNKNKKQTKKTLHKLDMADHKLKFHEIAEELTISEGTVFTILHEICQ